jgi:hypothetical protein
MANNDSVILRKGVLEKRGGKTYLILRRGTPIRQSRWIGNARFQAVCAERAEHDARSAEEGADCPEGHCDF